MSPDDDLGAVSPALAGTRLLGQILISGLADRRIHAEIARVLALDSLFNTWIEPEGRKLISVSSLVQLVEDLDDAWNRLSGCWMRLVEIANEAIAERRSIALRTDISRNEKLAELQRIETAGGMALARADVAFELRSLVDLHESFPYRDRWWSDCSFCGRPMGADGRSGAQRDNPSGPGRK